MTRSVARLLDLRALLKLRRVMRRARALHHRPYPHAQGRLAARLAGVPVVVDTLDGFYFHEHMRPPARRFYIAIERIAARCSDSVLSRNSEDMQTGLSERIFPPERVGHLSNGIDLSEKGMSDTSGAWLAREAVGS